MPPAAKAPVTWFALFNLIAAPLIGRGVWALMLTLVRDDFRLVAVLVSVIGAVAMWLITGGTFAITIGFGVFSPINLLIALVGAAAR